MDIGTNMRNARKQKGLSQVEVSQKAGIAVNSLRLYEAGKRQPNLNTLKKIANALDIPVYELDPNFHEYIGFSFGTNLLQPRSDEKEQLMQVGKENAPTDDEVLKINCAAVSSYMEKMNRAGQAVAVQTVKTLADMPEYQKKDESGQE